MDEGDQSALPQSSPEDPTIIAGDLLLNPLAKEGCLAQAYDPSVGIS